MGQDRKKIMLVDDSITNLTSGKNALTDHYDVFTVPSGEKLFKILEQITPDLILLDIEMPGMNGYEIIKILKSHHRTAEIPVIFLTAMSDPGNELEGLSLGALDYITKPFSPPLLSKRVELHLLLTLQKKQLLEYNTNLQHLVDLKTQTVLELQNAVFDLLSEIVEYRDDETGGHINRVQKFYKMMLEAMNRHNVYLEEISAWDQRLVMLSSLLHDIGKVGIRDNILLKPARLTPEEFEIMKTHTTMGAKIIEKIEKNTSERYFIKHAKLMAATHHEKWDGSGYPIGLARQTIPLQGRIMAIVDVYDALTSYRPYKEPMTQEQALEIIKKGKGNHFDPALVDVFLKITDELYTVSEQKLAVPPPNIEILSSK